MNKQILILLFFVPGILFAQQTKKIVNRTMGETFYVLKSDKKKRHGEYAKFSFNRNLLVKGYYKFGAKDSIWECFDFGGQLTLKYDYSEDELVFYKPNDKVKDKKYRIIVNGTKLDTILSRPPVFLGGDGFIMSEIGRNLRYPIEAMEKGKSGRAVVLFTVDKYGKTSNYYVETPIGYGMDEEAIRTLKLIPNDWWLPGLLNGQPVDVEVDYPINFYRLNLDR